ncbi:MAG: hypothetical protein H6728_01575 [Myxococcales bacterium]|nr:hypothetical protein [Myxococcales bacterium]
MTLIWQGAMRAMAGLAQVTASAQCVYIGGTAVNTECQLSKVSTAAKLAILIAQEATTITLGIQVNDARKEMAALQRDFPKSTSKRLLQRMSHRQPQLQ